MNYYERHIGDYIKDTSHLSLMEHGIYTRLLDVYYTRESAVPADQAARLVGARSKDEREALAVVLEEFFAQSEGAWFHARCECEILKYQEKAAKNREVGRLGGRPKKSQPKTNQDGSQQEPTNNHGGYFEEPKQNPPQYPVTSNQYPVTKEEKTAPAKRSPPLPIPDGVDSQVWGDWLQLRKTKKAPVTQTVVYGAEDQAVLAGMTLNDFLKVWCRRGSQGLEAAWLKPDERPTNHAPINKQIALEQRNRAVAAQWAADMEAKHATQ